jgi:adenylosuccinate lyase
MAAVHAGGDRQELHERIRQHSQSAAQRVKQEGRSNDLLERLKADSAFAKLDIATLMNPQDFVGRAPEQVDEFLAEIVGPIRQRYASAGQTSAEIKV